MKTILRAGIGAILAAVCAAVCAALAPAPAFAQATTLNFALTATYQLPNRTNASGDITVSLTASVKWTPEHVLSLLTNSLGLTLPKGSYLAQDNGAVEIIIDNGLDSTNVGSVLTFDTTGTEVVSGSANTTTGKQNQSYIIYAAATFDDGNGNTFNVDGLLRETVTLGAQNGSGNQTQSISFFGNVAGYGTVVDKNSNTNAAVFSGTISGAGKGVAGS